jgi:P-type Ca2+ transporter type 2C
MGLNRSVFSSELGLDHAEAQRRLQAEGYNELPRTQRRTLLRIAVEVLREPMLALLLAAGGVYLALGDLRESLVLLLFATMSVMITVIQEARTERVLEALRDLTSPRALVIRGGEQKRIAGREVVRGDLVILAEGDRVPADARIVRCQDLLIDESLLTGESVPVSKRPAVKHDELSELRPGGDNLPYVFSGSLVVRGGGLTEVTATGVRSEIGKIGLSLEGLDVEPPRLQTETRRVVQNFALVGGAVSLLVVVLYGLLRGGWLDATLAGIALGMSMLPEELPVVITVFLAMGAWRISKARVLTRRAAAIETLGSATVLCTDKTGTLTENRMSIVELRTTSGGIFRPQDEPETKIPSNLRDVLQWGALASAADATDPMDRAFLELARTQRLETSGSEHIHTYGLRPDLLAVTNVWRARGGPRGFVIAAKGAPEAIAELCHLGNEDRAVLSRAVDAMADAGLRVLCVARASSAAEVLPESQHEFKFEMLGLAGLADPLRKTVPTAVQECRTAGIKVVMITGDYPATGKAIARQAGLSVEGTITGEELDRLSEAQLIARVGSTTIFARIMPAQKLRIVNAFKANGETVAMTGDGVNDAPSLKAAHIGIAMGGRGTDVAREASSMVLLDEDFGSIVKAIRLGRRIYDNVRKAMEFIFAVHVPIAGLAILPLISGLPVIFWPIHIAFLEMVIDPVCSLVFEAEVEEDNVMKRPPRRREEPLFSKALIIWSLFQGLMVFSVVAVVFVLAWNRGMAETEVRALTFFSLVTTIVGLIYVNRSFGASVTGAIRRPNRALAMVLIAVAVMLILTITLPVAKSLFHFGTLHWDDLGATLVAGVLSLVLLEQLKPLFQEKRNADRVHQLGDQKR